VHQFYGTTAPQAKDALDAGTVHYGHIQVLQFSTDVRKTQQPFGFRRHSEESPTSSMLVHSCAGQVIL
jgi:hypothetical protein